MRGKTTRTLSICAFALLTVAAPASCNNAHARFEVRPGREPFGSWDNLDETLRTDPKALGEVDAFGRTRLHVAARQGRTKAIELLIANGAKVDGIDRWGWSPLCAAVEADERQAAERLIAKGADVNVRNKDDWTALNMAALLGRLDMVKLLLC